MHCCIQAQLFRSYLLFLDTAHNQQWTSINAQLRFMFGSFGNLSSDLWLDGGNWLHKLSWSDLIIHMFANMQEIRCKLGQSGSNAACKLAKHCAPWIETPTINGCESNHYHSLLFCCYCYWNPASGRLKPTWARKTGLSRPQLNVAGKLKKE